MNINQNFVSIDEMRHKLGNHANQVTEKNTRGSGKSFDRVLHDTADEVRFSKHAAKRLELRNISISDEQKARLEDAADQAMEKGMTESLVMVDNLAFILNVRNKTIVTAVNDTANAVFTNIDGAIIN
ncbi:MAG: flagellar protein [Roseburia sp.]|nr:flagellar protein [Roseburia sp.]